MTKSEISRCIRVTGLSPDYTVHCDVPGRAIVCCVAHIDQAMAMVKALRELESRHEQRQQNVRLDHDLARAAARVRQRDYSQ
jgi:hypothetical protein